MGSDGADVLDVGILDGTVVEEIVELMVVFSMERCS